MEDLCISATGEPDFKTLYPSKHTCVTPPGGPDGARFDSLHYMASSELIHNQKRTKEKLISCIFMFKGQYKTERTNFLLYVLYF